MKIGYVLSGGGIRGIAHFGAIKALEEQGIKPSIISGASAGAIVGAFYAAGYKPKEIIAIINEVKIFNPQHFKIWKAGLFDMGSFESIFLKYFPENTFESLNLPLYVAATEIKKGEIKYFSEGNLSKALMASSCIPIVFQPVEYLGMTLVDGGVLNNFPIEPLFGNCDKIVGVHVNAIDKTDQKIHMKDVLDRTFHLSLNNSAYLKSHKCDLLIDPPWHEQIWYF